MNKKGKKSKIDEFVEMGVNAIIRPPRSEYDPNSLPLKVFIPGYGNVDRKPISFKNSRGLKIVGSFYAPSFQIPEMSCVVYLHGNASSQREGTFLVPVFVPSGVGVLCFDFAGCGASEGEYISLGLFEKDDVACAINFVREQFGVGKVAIWGRSMGAATAFYAMSEDPTIAGAVADSSFSSLPILIGELGKQYNVPTVVSKSAVWYVSGKIEKLAKFDIRKVEPIEAAKTCFTPVLIIHGLDDNFINFHHSQDIYDKYAGDDKDILLVEGDHNSERPMEVKVQAIMFLANILDCPIVMDEIPMLLQQSGRHHFSSFEDMLCQM
ncbi:Clan SC, family S9, unassigned serine peptidase [Histomonas meleagridis]|uniref:Clan SC, family S9, unassigned serine peptidase n=1 Tax=Histomonas meleagridis TaxID=135588 RepID=UPI00355A6720|nr:Clan SC, family S9, unassigned serine peptidase [Histomonas meleagridis]KAH0797849.1 Clan SC, family S9, unassigned serine peptidase [Histomonas meleagridis]